ncbi:MULTISPECIES: N-acetylneuraminate lyase [Psychrilyobacter]|uniref:N-acetylneuraminate lyase n=1 Tax=Psychrilyobacter piezotolerans TaxID=2293438 RepID=A0ABX9KIK4_9FUSO|nr:MULTISPECIES: N-acetylneuraminate lyase [Psychrilyobacter]MCS5420605.1 N-acetylneuraminate lyase [Psychrilyobacter sp. S5]NDI77376.1 N-acetylneuraminate lyase [Psychrilyobacter piezotolerans]RDE63681.1 N-acetylneuraminate lyase [Psychrilyobacter sp. S5]REI42025.1 N-acetylneuraminate lyase [Psychrilyobacter piezotolerans]
MKTKLGGIYSALMVAYDEDGNINENGTREIIRHNIHKMEVDGLYVGGSTGENFMISTEEKKRILYIAMDEGRGQVKLMAQVGSVNLKEAVELGKYATDLGYDALSAVTPFYYKFDFEEIKNYYNTIIEATGNYMVIYFIPSLTGVNLSLDQFGELFENEKIIGVKFSHGDFFLLERLRKAYPDHLIYAGLDEMMLSAAVLHVDGGIGSTYNVNGIRAKQIYTLAKGGKIKEARELQHTTNDLIEGILANGLYQTIKEIMKTQGVDAGYCRQPTKRLSEEGIIAAKELAEKYL